VLSYAVTPAKSAKRFKARIIAYDGRSANTILQEQASNRAVDIRCEKMIDRPTPRRFK
jgi:hypothetical protein